MSVTNGWAESTKPSSKGLQKEASQKRKSNLHMTNTDSLFLASLLVGFRVCRNATALNPFQSGSGAWALAGTCECLGCVAVVLSSVCIGKRCLWAGRCERVKAQERGTVWSVM